MKDEETVREYIKVLDDAIQFGIEIKWDITNLVAFKHILEWVVGDSEL